MKGFLNNNDKSQCFGCEACEQVCGKRAIAILEDEDGFRYPQIDKSICVNCGLCNKICPYENMPVRYGDSKYVFGGYSLNEDIRFESTSGGAFSEIVNAFCDENYVIFCTPLLREYTRRVCYVRIYIILHFFLFFIFQTKTFCLLPQIYFWNKSFKDGLSAHLWVNSLYGRSLRKSLINSSRRGFSAICLRIGP